MYISKTYSMRIPSEILRHLNVQDRQFMSADLFIKIRLAKYISHLNARRIR